MEMGESLPEKAHERETAVSRRRFLQLILGSLGALAALEVTGVGLLYLRPRAGAAQQHGKVLAGRVEEFPPGSVTEFRDGRFFLLRTADGGFLALYRRCPHLGCTLNWQPHTRQFYCPCHASTFDEYGNIADAPAGRALDTFAVSIENNQVIINTRLVIQRTQFSREQLTYVKDA